MESGIWKANWLDLICISLWANTGGRREGRTDTQVVYMAYSENRLYSRSVDFSLGRAIIQIFLRDYVLWPPFDWLTFDDFAYENDVWNDNCKSSYRHLIWTMRIASRAYTLYGVRELGIKPYARDMDIRTGRPTTFTMYGVWKLGVKLHTRYTGYENWESN